ncbi:hypothetical protein IAI10_15470 [Clostridium sp. 19966]|uniref:hypothetical protein n=1 Tax=Clostridium sp. 19966 TaxID=2768166 RepID=UPI0028E036C3|nr:hypothetical protein [Clostridium sp. 19966]MDT8718065.1 hypothetical protein [Clostridium sp. 19966]
MRKIWYIILSTLFILIFLVCYLWTTGTLKYFNTKPTDLSKENINNVYLNKNYNLKVAEEAFGVVTKKVDNSNYTDYEFTSSSTKIATVRVHNNKIIGIFTQDFDDSLRTEKNITFTSSFEDIVKAYGNNFKKSIYKDEMGSGERYDITFVDKKNKFNLVFEFTKIDNNDKLNFIQFSKY